MCLQPTAYSLQLTVWVAYFYNVAMSQLDTMKLEVHTGCQVHLFHLT